MHTTRFYFFLSVCLLASSLLAGAKSPAEKLAGTVDAALEVVYGDRFASYSAKDKQEEVLRLLEANFDTTVLIRRAIGRNWKLMNADEQEQLLDLVKKLVIKAYVQGMDAKERPVVSFQDLIEVSPKRIEIPSTVVLDGTSIRVLYRMGMMKSEWEIFDIVTEDISVVSNFRQQFDDHFRNGNGEQLIVKLQKLLDKEELDEYNKL